MNVSTSKMCLDTSILANSIMGRREYHIFPYLAFAYTGDNWVHSSSIVQASPAGRSIFVSETVQIGLYGSTADNKIRPARMDRGGGTQWADAFIAHLAGMHVPTAEARRPAQNSGICHRCRQNLDARANNSRRPCQCLALVRATYKSGRRVPAMGTKKPLLSPAATKSFPLPASNGSHRQ
jgi:hypothetical protein